MDGKHQVRDCGEGLAGRGDGAGVAGGRSLHGACQRAHRVLKAVRLLCPVQVVSHD